jgi:hypothetical protein
MKGSDMMNQIKKFLDNNKVAWNKFIRLGNQERIMITLQKDNVWVNGYGEEMKWDRTVTIYQNTWKKYVAVIETGYNMNQSFAVSGKQKDIIEKLQLVLADWNLI